MSKDPCRPHIGRRVPLLKPTQSPHCYLGAFDHTKKISPPLATLPSPVLSHLLGHLDPIVRKPFDIAQVCHANKICSKLALTWKLTLKLTFPAHCISNWKLNGISRTNISKVTLNAANERARCRRTPAAPGHGVKLCSGAWKRGPESPVGVNSLP